MNKRILRAILACVLGLGVLGTNAMAAPPDSVNYSGVLKDNLGNPVTDTLPMTFTIYNSGGSPLWTETQPAVEILGGQFNALLGAVNPLNESYFSTAPLTLGISVDGGAELTPRTALVTVPYAHRVSTVDGSTGGSISGNIDVAASTATEGNILKSGTRFIHNYGTGSTFIGLNSGNFTMTGVGNTGTGYSALSSATTGGYNTAHGVYALTSNTTGTENTAFGTNALLGNVGGHRNTAVGFLALQSNTAGNGNTATGNQALRANANGNWNTAAGEAALFNNTDGWGNTSMGTSSLHLNIIGHANAAFGIWSLNSNVDGDSNTACGYGALGSNTTGINNTGIGADANVASGNLTNATAIGANAVVNASNKIRLGDANVTVLECQVGLTVVSDSTQKENIRPVDGEEVLRKLRGLNLASWNLKGHDPEQFRHYGPMAQEFFAAFGNDGVGTIGTPTTINSGDMAGILMIAVQALEKDNDELRAQVAELRELIRAQSTQPK